MKRIAVKVLIIRKEQKIKAVHPYS